MTATLTKPSTPRLSEVARHVVIPSGIVTTGWPAVEAKCREFGDEFDDWQRGAGRLILGKREDGSYAATIGGVTLSIPRQVAKTFLVGRIVFALCVLFPGLRVIWTAHRTRTASNTFKTLQGYAKRAKVAPHIADIRRANGEQEIVFSNGSIIMFGAREAGFGRGFDEIDIEVFDEAQILTERALDDMVAATNQSRHPHGALLFFMGTPPRPVDPGEAFTARRTDALTHKPDPDDGFGDPVVGEDQLYIECSADRGADPDDRKQWAKANPSYPVRTPVRSMLRLRKNLLSDESWCREALGIWDEPKTLDAPRWEVIAEEPWNACGIDTWEGEPLAWSIDVAPGSRSAAISCSDGETGEVIDYRAGTDWCVARLLELRERHGFTEVALDANGPAGALLNALEVAGIEVRKVTITEHAQACGDLLAHIDQGTFHHIDQDPLTAAAACAAKRTIVDVWLWARSKAGADICPLVAVTLARWFALTLREDGEADFFTI